MPMPKEIGVGVIGLGMGKNMLAVNQDAHFSRTGSARAM